ncbi:SHOCT domain-containing protein [Streptomyces sp. NPDC057555]|uniref:SHOCT domain-containing protein n=1 Tax=Streptomyces sp. NPDC057555 TaxID=3346166 RepID=UPI0036CBD9D3
MMYWYGHDGGWGWIAATIGMILFWALVITVGILVFRALTRSGPSGDGERSRGPAGWSTEAPPPGGPPAAEQILAERYARGEIEDAEYQRRLAVLRSSQGGPARSDTGPAQPPSGPPPPQGGPTQPPSGPAYPQGGPSSPGTPPGQ